MHRLDASRCADFLRLHCDANGLGWCRCVAWWVPAWEGWGERTAEQNLALRESLFERGELDGYLAYEGREPVAWCQVGRRDRLEKLTRTLALEPDPSVWAITCFAVAPRARGRGVASTLLARVLADLARRGVRRVEAFPRRGEELDAADLWNGPAAMYAAAGFELAREGSPRAVLALELPFRAS